MKKWGSGMVMTPDKRKRILSLEENEEERREGAEVGVDFYLLTFAVLTFLLDQKNVMCLRSKKKLYYLPKEKRLKSAREKERDRQEEEQEGKENKLQRQVEAEMNLSAGVQVILITH